MGDGDILQLDGRDPLPTRFNNIFRSIVDNQIAVNVEGSDIAGIKPAISGQRTLIATKIVIDHPVATNLQISLTFAITRQRFPVDIHHPQIDTENRPSLPITLLTLLLRREYGVLTEQRIDRTDGRRFRHPLGMDQLNIIIALKRFSHRWR